MFARTEQEYFSGFSGRAKAAQLRWFLPPDGLIHVEKVARTFPGVTNVKWGAAEGKPCITIYYDPVQWTEQELEDAIDAAMEFE